MRLPFLVLLSGATAWMGCTSILGDNFSDGPLDGAVASNPDGSTKDATGSDAGRDARPKHDALLGDVAVPEGGRDAVTITCNTETCIDGICAGDVCTCGSPLVLCGDTCLRECVVTLATGQRDPQGIVADSVNVYWANTDSIVTVPVDGGALITLTAGVQASGYLTVDTNQDVFWTQGPLGSGAVMECNVTSTGCAKGVVNTLQMGSADAGDTVGIGPIAVGGGYVVWSSYAPNGPEGPLGSAWDCVFSIDKCVSTTPLTSDDTAGIAFPIAVANQGSGSSAAPWFYWAENENNIIHGLPLASSGGSTVPTNLTSESSNQGAIYSVVTAMTADGTNVYWTQGSSVFSVPVSPAIDDADGGAPVATLAVSSTNQTSTGLSAIASDGVNVYWAWTSSGDGGQSTGSIVKCAIGGCETPTTLAAKQDAPFGIAVDATSVYWTTGNGTVMKVTPK